MYNFNSGKWHSGQYKCKMLKKSRQLNYLTNYSTWYLGKVKDLSFSFYFRTISAFCAPKRYPPNIQEYPVPVPLFWTFREDSPLILKVFISALTVDVFNSGGSEQKRKGVTYLWRGQRWCGWTNSGHRWPSKSRPGSGSARPPPAAKFCYWRNPCSLQRLKERNPPDNLFSTLILALDP